MHRHRRLDSAWLSPSLSRPKNLRVPSRSRRQGVESYTYVLRESNEEAPWLERDTGPGRLGPRATPVALHRAFEAPDNARGGFPVPQRGNRAFGPLPGENRREMLL